MRRLESPGLARAGCVAMMLPLTPGWLVTMPLAVWALLVLRRRDVAEAFRSS